MISFKDEVQRIALKGTSRLVFKTENGMVLNWKNGDIWVSGGKPKYQNHPLWYGGVEVPDVYMQPYETLTLIGCEVNGITFKIDPSKVVLGWSFRVGEDDPDEEGLLDYLLYWWVSDAPKVSQSKNLKCNLTDERFLDGMVGMFYNGKCGYYATLQKLVDYYGNNHFGINILDKRIDTLKKGFDAAATRGYELSYDGLIFTARKKD